MPSDNIIRRIINAPKTRRPKAGRRSKKPHPATAPRHPAMLGAIANRVIIDKTIGGDVRKSYISALNTLNEPDLPYIKVLRRQAERIRAALPTKPHAGEIKLPLEEFYLEFSPPLPIPDHAVRQYDDVIRMMTHKARSRVSGELVGFLVSAPLTENIDLPDKGPQVACAAIVHFPTKASHVEGASVIRHFLLDPSDSSVSIHVHTLPIRENAVRLNSFQSCPRLTRI